MLHALNDWLDDEEGLQARRHAIYRALYGDAMSTNPAGSEYTCAHCRGTFLRASDDAEAIAEAVHDFGVPDASRDPAMVIICDDCYRTFMAWCRAVIRPGEQA